MTRRERSSPNPSNRPPEPSARRAAEHDKKADNSFATKPDKSIYSQQEGGCDPRCAPALRNNREGPSAADGSQQLSATPRLEAVIRTPESTAAGDKVGYHGVSSSEHVLPDLYPPHYEACGTDSLRGRAKSGTVVRRSSPAVDLPAEQPMRPCIGTSFHRAKRCAVKVGVVCGADAFVRPRVYAIRDVLRTLI
jgi:hypothetical protein